MLANQEASSVKWGLFMLQSRSFFSIAKKTNQKKPPL